ncbi:DNA polymerase I [Pelagibacterium xiamenense]|uniref:DNA polymerase I n=1 Tax=Pelagibacterium xiamenense TaxID=2901140 RepID=UPI001E4E02F4|nr:DNA polymerase I [Pelagibacterium xiamenense]MCD7058605.1 DNA polymerase I [Pelagibacterium xiamenense]
MHLVLVDGSSFIFRAYHALPPLTRKSDGLPVGAVSGFCNMLFKLYDDLKSREAPTHLAVIFDYSGKSFRNDLYPEYKAHRPEAPEDLIPQFPLTRTATRAFSIPSIEQEGYEADDIIATYATQAREKGAMVTIVSSDKDLMQLIGPDVSMLDTIARPGQPPLRWMGPEEVEKKFGVGPDKVVDVQALCGDAVDNVPGIPGIGVKTAALLINEYGDLDTLLARASEIKQNKRRETIIENAEMARISRELVRLKTDVPVEVPLEDLVRQPLEAKTLIPFLKAMEFSAFTRRVATALDVDPDDFSADTGLSASADGHSGETGIAADTGAAHATAHGPAEHAEAVLAKIAALPIDYEAYEIVREPEALAAWVARIIETGHVAIDTETTGLDNQRADLVGICLSTAPGNGCYIPVGHTVGEGDMFGSGRAEGQMPPETALAMLKPVFEDPAILKIGQNIKYDIGMLARYGVDLNPVDDTMVMSYAIDGARNNGMDALAQRYLEHTPIKFSDIAGTGKAQKTFNQLEIETAAKYAAEDADITMRLWHVLKPRLPAYSGTTIYETVDRPLIPVLARMEGRGISVDRQILSELSGDFAQRAAALEAEAHEIAGERFNLGSPKQLGDILFGRMGLEGGTKTKTGAWSTGASVLDDLAARDVPLAKVILDWRGVTKLKSTYTDALPEYINPRTKRVHTSYHQAAVATGRLSSTDPNLQNIPIRTEDGRKIRTAFVAEDGNLLISADYSQIELRVLAHIADIQALKDAFEEGLDIHAMTASEMFGVPIEGMDPMIRRRAKAINFGIIYGISAFGLANQLGISRSEAGEYIKTYFERFPGIQDYMDHQRKTVKSQGFVSTIFGRKIPFENANTKNPSERAFIERASINAPIQGSAADIIRRAMIRMERVLTENQMAADMLLQVHDELIFEAPAESAEAAIPFICKTMEGAAEPALKLTVPLKVDAKAAKHWGEAH